MKAVMSAIAQPPDGTLEIARGTHRARALLAIGRAINTSCQSRDDERGRPGGWGNKAGAKNERGMSRMHFIQG